MKFGGLFEIYLRVVREYQGIIEVIVIQEIIRLKRFVIKELLLIITIIKVLSLIITFIFNLFEVLIFKFVLIVDLCVLVFDFSCQDDLESESGGEG